MLGKVLGNRYEIQKRLGGGGMALVFQGLDTLLNRTVTIKILREQLTGDEDFIRRFRREAQAVASLSHSNVVTVYDVGQEGETYYMVMEYVEGSNLKEIIKERAPLSPREAVDIARQIAEALEHAHENGIIHRDIKPHNILMTRNGRVKVTDFGIARAATTATVTMAGAIVGSVHYFSPEQARGQLTDEKSDLYSLGVVLYEMLTGRVPFEGESPISVAMQQIETPPEPPSRLNPQVPAALEEVVLRAMEKDPARRYQSAREMAADLDRVFTGKVIGRLPAKVEDGNDEPTLVVPAEEWALPEKAEAAKVKAKAAPRRKLNALGWAALFLGVMLTVALGTWGLKQYLYVPEFPVPNVVGQPLDAANRILKADGWEVELGAPRYDNKVPLNNVAAQDPAPGQSAKKTRAITIYPSQGPDMRDVPGVINLSFEDAAARLREAEFLIPTPKDGYSETVPAGNVMEQEPRGGAKAPLGSEVQLTISKGPEPKYIAMPDVVGLPIDQATQQLKTLGFEVKTESAPSNDYFSGQVAAQDKAAKSQVLQGETVVLTVSSGPGPQAKKADVTIPITERGRNHLVRIEVADQKGTRDVYSNLHSQGEKVVTEVTYFGKATIRVYIDNQMVKETKF